MAPLRSSSQGARAAIQGGIVLVLAAGLFDAAPLYVPGVAGLVLGLGCLAWVAECPDWQQRRREEMRGNPL